MTQSEYEPASVEAERIAWLRAFCFEIRRRLESSGALARWRKKVPRPLEVEALLVVIEPTDAGFQVPELAARLGLSVDRARALCRWARRIGVLDEDDASWRLSRRGRALLGELEAAHAEALRPVGRGEDPELWRWLWRRVAPLDVQNDAGPD